MNEIDQATADQIYLQQVAQHDKDARLQRVVTLLQGMAAVITVIVGIHVLIHSQKS